MTRYANHVFITLVILTTVSSGVLTFKGLVATYPEPTSYIKILFTLMIFAFITAIAFFWYLWNKFFALAHKTWKDIILTTVVSLIIITLILSTSTVFNIISLTGRISVEREINEKLTSLLLFTRKNIDLKHAELESIKNTFHDLSIQARLNRKEETKTGQGFMYNTYTELSFRFSGIENSIRNRQRVLGNKGGDNIAYKLNVFKQRFSYSNVYEAKKNLMDLTLSDVESNIESIEKFINSNSHCQARRDNVINLPV